jgi:hypothetical protein
LDSGDFGQAVRVVNGQPLILKAHNGYYEKCCRCGLTHLTIYEVMDKNTIRMTTYRDEYRSKRKR